MKCTTTKVNGGPGGWRFSGTKYASVTRTIEAEFQVDMYHFDLCTHEGGRLRWAVTQPNATEEGNMK